MTTPQVAAILALEQRLRSADEHFGDAAYIIANDAIALAKQQQAEIEALSETLAAANADGVQNYKDAERYRWLREHTTHSITTPDNENERHITWAQRPDALDAAIDAALTQQTQGER